MAQIFWDNFFLQKAQIKWDGWSIFFLRIYNVFCSFSLLILSQINICSFKHIYEQSQEETNKVVEVWKT
jgi:hypothetical protein